MINGINAISELKMMEQLSKGYEKAFQSNEITTSEVKQMGKGLAVFVAQIIDKFESSELRNAMLKSENYYLNQELAIEEKQRTYFDKYGNETVDPNLSNLQLKHPLVKKIVNQKTNYLLANPFIVQSDNLDQYYRENGQPDPAFLSGDILTISEDKGNQFVQELETNYFDNNFMLKLKNMGRESIIKGISWAYAHYKENEEGETCLTFSRIPAEQVIPFYRDTEKQELNSVIRFYTDVVYEPRKQHGVITSYEEREIRRMEYHTKDYVMLFKQDPDDIQSAEVDLEGGGISAQFEAYVPDKDEMIPLKWNKIPFIPFRSNFYEQPILNDIGSLVDAYSSIASTLTDMLIDTPSSILHVKNYNFTGTGDRGEAVRNINLYRLILTRDDGDAKYIKNEFDINSFETTLNRIRKDIYEGSSSVDTQEASLGNASASALKFRYGDMNSASNDMANEFEVGLDNMIYFIRKHLKEVEGKDYSGINYDIIFNTSMIVNEEEAVLNAQRLYGTVSDETYFGMLPQVENVSRELVMYDMSQKRATQREIDQQLSLFDALGDIMGEVDIESSEGGISGGNKSGRDLKTFGKERSDELNSASTKSPKEMDKQKGKKGTKATRRVNKVTTTKTQDKPVQ